MSEARQMQIRVRRADFWRQRWFGKAVERQEFSFEQFSDGKWKPVEIIVEDVEQ